MNPEQRSPAYAVIRDHDRQELSRGVREEHSSCGALRRYRTSTLRKRGVVLVTCIVVLLWQPCKAGDFGIHGRVDAALHEGSMAVSGSEAIKRVD